MKIYQRLLDTFKMKHKKCEKCQEKFKIKKGDDSDLCGDCTEKLFERMRKKIRNIEIEKFHIACIPDVHLNK